MAKSINDTLKDYISETYGLKLSTSDLNRQLEPYIAEKYPDIKRHKAIYKITLDMKNFGEHVNEYYNRFNINSSVTKIVYCFEKLEKSIIVDAKNFTIPSYGNKVNEYNEFLKVVDVEWKQWVCYVKLERF